MEADTTKGVRIEAEQSGNSVNRKIEVKAELMGHERNVLLLNGYKVFWSDLEASPDDYNLLKSGLTGLILPKEGAVESYIKARVNSGLFLPDACQEAADELQIQIREIVETLNEVGGQATVEKTFDLRVPGDSDE